MSHAQLAQKVLDHVRLMHYRGTVKSGNKMRQWEKPDGPRLFRANHLVSFLRTMTQEAAVEWQRYYGGGNCYDLALTASRVAVGWAPHTPVFVVGVSPPGDHAVCVIGGTAHEVLSPFEAWADDTWVCDPWANIACPGPAYTDAFRDKMFKWHNDRKRICFNNAWISPIDAGWLIHNFYAARCLVFASTP